MEAHTFLSRYMVTDCGWAPPLHLPAISLCLLFSGLSPVHLIARQARPLFIERGSNAVVASSKSSVSEWCRCKRRKPGCWRGSGTGAFPTECRRRMPGLFWSAPWLRTYLTEGSVPDLNIGTLFARRAATDHSRSTRYGRFAETALPNAVNSRIPSGLAARGQSVMVKRTNRQTVGRSSSNSVYFVTLLLVLSRTVS